MLVAACATLSACGPESAQASEAAATPSGPSKFVFNVENRARLGLFNVVVDTGIPLSFGGLDAREDETLDVKLDELPSKIVVHWTEAREQRYAKTFHPQRSLGRHYRGPVTITIMSRGDATMRKSR